MEYITTEAYLVSCDMLSNIIVACIIVCPHLQGNELHRQERVCIVVTSESLCGVMIAHWTRMPKMWV